VIPKMPRVKLGKTTAGLDKMGLPLWEAGMDQLNLTGILNVLDGVVVTGRDSNHDDKSS
jgi:hypothetical protein